MLFHSLYHIINALLRTFSLLVVTSLAAQLYVVFACHDKKSCYHQRFRLRAFRIILRSLETLIGIPREAIEVQAVIPVGTTDKRQGMRTEIFHDMIE